MVEESFRPGDSVWTAFGAGVIVKDKNENELFYTVRLWRVPGKSIASSSLAFLHPSSVRNLALLLPEGSLH